MAIAAMESKNVDVQLLAAAVFPPATATGTVTLLNGVAQGTTANQRIGRKLIMKSILMRIGVSKQPSTAGEGLMRLLVIYDAQTNAAIPLATDILQINDISSPMNLNNSDRFKVILDKTWNIGSVDNTSYIRALYKKCKLETKFNNGGGATVGDIQTGGLFALTYCTGLTTATVAGQVYSRIRYYD